MTGRTTSDTVVDAVSLVPVPVTVREYLPGTVVRELVIIT
jgi:phosphoribosylaminoimidazole-succinocarboxamide synthase